MAKKKKTVRRKDKKGVKLQDMLSKNKVLLAAIVSILLVVGIFYGTAYFILNNSFFSVREVVVKGEQGYISIKSEMDHQALFLGRNIFKVDLDVTESIRN